MGIILLFFAAAAWAPGLWHAWDLWFGVETLTYPMFLALLLGLPICASVLSALALTVMFMTDEAM